jgi:predicted DCC family thiol-disulfide oxidoreductase YuxK
MHSPVRFVVAGKPVDALRCTDCHTVVYDGDCRVCARIVEIMRRWDRHRRIAFVPSQHPDVRARFPWIPQQAYRESLQLIEPGGRTWQGAEAIDRILAVLPRGRLISWIFRIPFMKPIAERAYRWFARHRYRFGCGDHCTYRKTVVDFRDTGSD